MVNRPAPPPVEPPHSTPPPPPPPPDGPRGGSGGRPILPWVLIAASAVVIVVAGVILLTRDSETRAADTSDGTAATTTTTVAGSSLPTTTTTTDGATTTTTTMPVEAGGDYSAEGTWTVMVYGAADNNLEVDLLTDLREMRAATAGLPYLRFVVLADRSDGYTDAGLGSVGDWTTAKLLDVSGDAFTEVDDLGELNMGDPATLSDFMSLAVDAFPADHYALIMWDHGSMSGVGVDDSHADVLDTWEIAVGLEAGLAETGIDLDIVGFDACLMSSLEIVSAVAPYANYMIASEEYEPTDGWAYDGFTYLAGDGTTVEGLGTAIVQAYFDTSSPNDPTVTLSMIDLRDYPAFAEALEGFIDTALATVDTSAVEIGRRRDRSAKFGADPDPMLDFFMVDLGGMLNKLARNDSPVAEAAAEASRLLDAMVVANLAGEASKGARGLSVHFPPNPDLYFPTWYEAFGDPVWSGFLRGYFEAGRAIPVERRAAVVRTSPATEWYFDDYGLNLVAEIEPLALDTVVSAVLWSGIPEPDGSVTFYSSDQGIVEDPLAVGFYDLTQLMLSDGEDTAVAFQQISINEDLTVVTMTIPLDYRAPIDPTEGVYDDPVPVTLKVTYNLETEEFTEEVFASSLGTVGAFIPDAHGLFFPKLPHRLPDGTLEWVTTIDVGLWSDMPYLTYDFVDLPSGTPLYGELTVSDYGGNTAVVTATAEVP